MVPRGNNYQWIGFFGSKTPHPNQTWWCFSHFFISQYKTIPMSTEKEEDKKK
jgi:hypothetical protein